MMNRRQILCSAAASAAMFAYVPNVRAATYDLLIKGGRVIDPSVGLDGVRDVAIAGGRIVAVENRIACAAARTVRSRGAIARNRGVVVGVKARLSENVAGTNDLEGLRRAQEAASAFNLPVMIHIGQSVSPMRAILALLKRGDIVTHMYSPPPNSILDDQGRLFPDVAAARRRGVIFDFGNGVSGHFNWDMVERATKQGFWPDTLSTDWSPTSRTTGVVDFPNVMSKFLMFGMPLSQVVACATTNAATVFDSCGDRGTLNVGAPADVAILELREGNFEFLDNYEGKRTGRQRLFPIATVLNGKRTPARA